MFKKQISLLAILGFSIIFAQNIYCELSPIKDVRDLPENIPGETMGQKLESLLFWNQEEKERRFRLMHKIYPSLMVKPSEVIYSEIVKEETPLKYDAETYMKENSVKGLIVVQNGKIQLEAYADGVDENTVWTSFSVAKSISSMLVGVAHKEGIIRSLDDELQEYIPELKEAKSDYAQVTVRQLLTMTSGIDWNEDYTDPNSDVAQMYQKSCVGNEPHILTYMKTLPLKYEPGQQWNYSTGETDLVGILTQKASGKSLAEYLSEKIWKPYGMEHCAYWLADECSQLNIGGSGLSASLRDYARLGLLMLDAESDKEKSIFSEEWLNYATQNLYQTNENGGGYGYLWWRNPDGSYTANGIFGQLIYINPAKKLVIAQYAAWPQATSKELNEKRNEMIAQISLELFGKAGF